jgi:hypothetical protein
MMTDKSNCTFNISGGNVQILPNATQGIQNFYGDQFAEEALKASVNTDPGNAAPELSDEEQVLQLYINKVEVLKQYASRLSQCTSASDIGKIVVDMRKDEEVRVDEYEMVKERFINVLLTLAPHVTSGKTVSNVRQRIIDAWDRRK